MRTRLALFCFAVLAICVTPAHAAPFSVFPKAGQLPSQDGRFVVRNADRSASFSEFTGDFHSLFLEDKVGDHSRKLCDYVGVAAVGWANSDFIIVTEYLNNRTSRALVFVAASSEEPVVIDKPLLTHLVPINLRPQLRENDHVFVEAAQVEGETLALRVWGYGPHDGKGFRWRCEYSLREGGISCEETAEVHR